MSSFLAKHRSTFALLALAFLSMGMAGCAAPNWITDTVQIITLVAGFASSILTALSFLAPGVVPVAVAATIIAIINKLLGGLTDIENAVAEYNANPQPSALTKVEELVQVAIDNATSFMNDTGITNVAFQSQVQKILALILKELKSYQSMLPALKAQAGEKLSITVPMTSKEAKAEFNAIISTPTGDAEVDAAFAHVKKL